MDQVDQASHCIKPANKPCSVGSERQHSAKIGACLTVNILASAEEPEKGKSSHILMAWLIYD